MAADARSARAGGRLLPPPLPSAARPRRATLRRAAQPVLAMVNVDFSPSVVMGVAMIGAGISLWQVRR